MLRLRLPGLVCLFNVCLMLAGRGGLLRTFMHPILVTLRTYEVSRTRREVYDRVVEHLGAAGVAVPCLSLIWVAVKELK